MTDQAQERITLNGTEYVTKRSLDLACAEIAKLNAAIGEIRDALETARHVVVAYGPELSRAMAEVDDE